MSSWNAVQPQAVQDAEVQRDATMVPVAPGRREAIALNRLFVSQKNARKLRNPESIPALAAMIEAQGLLYPLCVVPEQQATLAHSKQGRGARSQRQGKDKGRGKGWKDRTARPDHSVDGGGAGSYGVVAGGRRLAALQWLVAQGRMAQAAPIDCLVFEVQRGAAVSLTENVAQEAMHPADQLLAFKTLVDDGQSAGQIAAAFGVSPLTVQRRLKLASLAPPFIDLYRQGSIEMDVLQALALSDDAAQQLQVWESLAPYNRCAHQIRQLLTDGEVQADAPLARFVGLQAYRAAGGAVRGDLFAAEGEGFFLQDGALLNRLALDKLHIEATKLREAGWKWAQARLTFPYAERARFSQLHCEQAVPTKKEQAAINAVHADCERVRARMDALEAIGGEDEDEDEADPQRGWSAQEQAEYNALQAQWHALDSQLAAMRDALRVWTPAQKAIAGVVLSLDRQGQVDAVEGLVSAEDRQALTQARAQRATPDLGSDDDPGGVLGGGASFDEGAPYADMNSDVNPRAATPVTQRAAFSAALCQSLTAHRSAAVAAAFTQSPKAALAALLHTLIANEREPWLRSPLGVRFDSNAHGIASSAVEYEETPAAQLLAQAEVVFDRLPGDSARLFDHLQGMDECGLLEVLALFVGRAYSVQCGQPQRAGQRGFDPATGIERVLGVDMAEWWSPTPERFLRHVPKAKMIAAVRQACGAPAAQPLQTMKKDEAVKAAAALLAGQGWLPTTLRPYRTDGEAANDEADDESHQPEKKEKKEKEHEQDQQREGEGEQDEDQDRAREQVRGSAREESDD